MGVAGTLHVPAAPAEPAPDLSLRFRILRWVSGFALALFVLIGYTWLSTWNVMRFTDGLPSQVLWTRLDRSLPTIPAFIWPYALYYLLVFLPMFAVRRVRELVEVLTAYFVVTVLAWIVYALWPVRMEYPHLVCTGVSCDVLLRLWIMDMGVNVMPSQHAAHSALAAAIFVSYRSRAWPLMVAGATAVSVAAVLTRQHFVLDIPAGIALAIAGWLAVRWAFRVYWPEGGGQRLGE
jgi:hypothetical protein